MATRVTDPRDSDYRTHPGMPRGNDRTLSDLVKELRDETTILIQQELALAKTETSEKVSKVARNAAYIATGALIAYAGFIFLLLACSEGLVAAFAEWGMDPQIAIWLAPLLIGAIVCIAGYVFLQKGISTLRNESVVPEKTVASLKEDKEWVRHKLA